MVGLSIILKTFQQRKVQGPMQSKPVYYDDKWLVLICLKVSYGPVMNLFYLCGVRMYVVARIMPAAPKAVLS